MIFDGKKVAEDIKKDLKNKFADREAVLAVVLVGDDPASAKFVERKKKFGEEIGVEVRVLEFEEGIDESDLALEVEKLADNDSVGGIVVQLPLPCRPSKNPDANGEKNQACPPELPNSGQKPSDAQSEWDRHTSLASSTFDSKFESSDRTQGFSMGSQINTERILNLIPANKDVDALTENASVDSPVVEAVMEIFARENIDLDGKKILVVGQGKLVGRPIAIRLAQEGFDVETATASTKDLKKMTLAADVIISGVGKPGLITKDAIKEGAVLIDAGTSEQASKLSGDADPACAEKCALFTPVPGGVGPMVVAMLFKNLLRLSR